MDRSALTILVLILIVAVCACAFESSSPPASVSSSLDADTDADASGQHYTNLQRDRERTVFRPNDPAGSHDGVYTTWNAVYTALKLQKGLGRSYLEFDDSYGTPVIPAGRWTLSSNIYWDSYNDNPTCTVELADGAQIVLEAPPGARPDWQPVLTLVGTNLRILSNRVGPVAPFIGVSFVLTGNRVRLLNTVSTAKPMIEVFGPNNFIAIAGNVALGGLGDSAALPAPLVDVKGGSLIVAGGGGYVSDNAFTDTVGGGTVNMRVMSDGFGGGNNAQSYDYPGLTRTGATVNYSIETRDRYRVASAIASPSLTTFNATYNALVLVNATAGPITIMAPKARNGDRFTVKDVGGVTDGIAIAASADGDFVEDGTLLPFQAKTYAADTAGHWWCVGTTSAAPITAAR